MCGSAFVCIREKKYKHTIEEHHHFHRQIEQLCSRLGAQLRRDYEGTSLDTLRHMVVMGMGVAFLPNLYIRSEIHRPRELRVATVRGEVIERTHALAWRASSPARQLFRQIADEIRTLVAQDLADVLQPILATHGRHHTPPGTAVIASMVLRRIVCIWR